MIILAWNKASSMAAVLLADHNVYISPTVLISMGIMVLLCLWHLWKFNIRPHFYPDNPKELPYWIPCTCAGR